MFKKQSSALSRPLSLVSIVLTVRSPPQNRQYYPTMISAEEALQTILKVAQRLLPVSVPLHDALGKVLAEDIRAPDPLPPYPASVKVFIN